MITPSVLWTEGVFTLERRDTMLTVPMDVLKEFPVRKTGQQRQAFRDAVQSYAEMLGYPCVVEAESFGCKNLVIGDSEHARYLVTANYAACARLPFPGQSSANTSGVVTLLEIMRSLPENQRKHVCFVLFDLGKTGRRGSASYRSTHREETDRQMVLNLDSVGAGDYITMVPTKRLKLDRKRLTSLYKACGYFGKKSILLREKGVAYLPSDQMYFPYGVGICALRKQKKLLWPGRVKDTALDYTNVNLLRAALITYICRDAVQ